jgi:hypothetical protein
LHSKGTGDGSGMLHLGRLDHRFGDENGDVAATEYR